MKATKKYFPVVFKLFFCLTFHLTGKVFRTSEDPVLQSLSDIVIEGWQVNKANSPPTSDSTGHTKNSAL